MIEITGIVVSGLSEGQKYLSMNEYREQIKTKLGYIPFNGTLNVKVSSEDKHKIRYLQEKKGIVIDGFVKNGRVYGKCKCFNSTVNNIKCAVIIPEKSKHNTDTIELISAYCLREKLNIKDISKIKIEIYL